MKLSLQYEMQRPELDDHKVITETMEQCILADEVGFDKVWFVEHHFLTGFSASPSPDIFFGALSQRTERIRLGLGVVVLPYHHPVQVAERVAMLDHISNGRVEFGTGRSAPYELDAFGVDPRESRGRWEEALSMIPDIWRSDWYSHEGQFWTVPERQILPKPYQNPHPPISVAAFQPSTYELAAAKGIGVLAFGSSAPELMQPHIEKYREDIKKANPVGDTVNNSWISSTIGITHENSRKGRDLGAESLKGFFAPGRPYVQGQKDIYDQLLSRWGGSEEVPDDLKQNFSRYVDDIDDENTSVDGQQLDYSGGGAISHKVWDGLTPDTLCERAVTISGNPDDCIAALKKHEATGIDEMMVMMQLDTVTHEQVMDSIRLWGKYIIPEFQKSASKVE